MDLGSDTRPLLGTALDTCTGTIAGVPTDSLPSRSPCDEMDVRALIAHLLTVVERIRRVGAGEDPFDFPEVAPEEVGDDAGLARWEEGVHAARSAWEDDESLDRTVTLPWMTAPGRIVAVTYVAEVTVHTWDLARATDQSPDFDPTVVAVSLESMRMALPGEGRREMLEAIVAGRSADGSPAAVPFGEAVETAPDATGIEQLVAWCGRRP